MNLKPKSIDGQALNGAMFAELSQTYVEAINSESIPTISSAWERVIDSEIRRVFDEANNELDVLIQEKMAGRLPIELEEMDRLKKEIKRKSMGILNSKTIANAPPEKLIEMRTAFEERAQAEFAVIEAENYESSQEHCLGVYETLHA